MDSLKSYHHIIINTVVEYMKEPFISKLYLKKKEKEKEKRVNVTHIKKKKRTKKKKKKKERSRTQGCYIPK